MLIVPAILMLIGAYLAWRGLRGVRCGTESHCRRCDYNLSGQIERRCPECGSPFTDKTIVHGERRRSHRRITAGAICLAFASTLVLPGVRQYIQRTWERESIHYLPTFVLIHRLENVDPMIRGSAMVQLRLRIQSGYLSRQQMAAAAESLFAGGTPEQTWLSNWLIGEFLKTDVLSWEQKRRFFGIWVAPQCQSNSAVLGKGPFLFKRLDGHHRSWPELRQETKIWMLQTDDADRHSTLLSSSDLTPFKIHQSLKVRVSTTWYLGGQHSEPRQEDDFAATIVRSPPAILCRLVKDVRYERPKVWTQKYRPEEWTATILADGTDPATMPAP